MFFKTTEGSGHALVAVQRAQLNKPARCPPASPMLSLSPASVARVTLAVAPAMGSAAIAVLQPRRLPLTLSATAASNDHVMASAGCKPPSRPNLSVPPYHLPTVPFGCP
jgi:hypothetical protein